MADVDNGAEMGDLFCFFLHTTGSPLNKPPVEGGKCPNDPSSKAVQAQFAPYRYSEGKMSKEKSQTNVVEEDPN